MNIQSFRGLFGVSKSEPPQRPPTPDSSLTENPAQTDGYTASLPPVLMPMMSLSLATPAAPQKTNLLGSGNEQEQASEIHYKTKAALGISSFEPRKVEKESRPKDTSAELGYQLSDRQPGSWRNRDESSSGNSASYLNNAKTIFMEDSDHSWTFQGGGGDFGGGGASATI